MFKSVVARGRLSGTPDAQAGRWSEGSITTMSLTATAHSVRGSLRQEVLIDGRHRLFTDEPERLGGEDSGPAPHELFPAALAACISTTLLMYARTKDWELGDVTVEVDYDHTAVPRRFEIAIELDGDLTDAQLERLEKVASACPLRRSIEAGIEFTETIERRSVALRQP